MVVFCSIKLHFLVNLSGIIRVNIELNKFRFLFATREHNDNYIKITPTVRLSKKYCSSSKIFIISH